MSDRDVAMWSRYYDRHLATLRGSLDFERARCPHREYVWVIPVRHAVELQLRADGEPTGAWLFGMQVYVDVDATATRWDFEPMRW